MHFQARHFAIYVFSCRAVAFPGYPRWHCYLAMFIWVASKGDRGREERERAGGSEISCARENIVVHQIKCLSLRFIRRHCSFYTETESRNITKLPRTILALVSKEALARSLARSHFLKHEDTTSYHREDSSGGTGALFATEVVWKNGKQRSPWRRL